MCEHDIYALPTVEFVGGSTQDFAFHTYFRNGARKMDLSECSAVFSVLNYANKFGEPIVSKAMTVESDTDGAMNVLRAELSGEETVALHGKYIYQITITDADGSTDIPKQGILKIINNIDKKLIL